MRLHWTESSNHSSLSSKFSRNWCDKTFSMSQFRCFFSNGVKNSFINHARLQYCIVGTWHEEFLVSLADHIISNLQFACLPFSSYCTAQLKQCMQLLHKYWQRFFSWWTCCLIGLLIDSLQLLHNGVGGFSNPAVSLTHCMTLSGKMLL